MMTRNTQARRARKFSARTLIALFGIALCLQPIHRAQAGPATNTAGEPQIVLDLNSAVRVGIANDFALRSIAYRKEAARQLLTERWRAYLPSVGVSFDRTRTINDADPDALTSEIRLTIEQLVYDGGQRALDVDLAKIDALLAEEDFKLTYAQLTRSIQNAYLDALTAHGKIQLNIKSLERAQVQLRQAQLEEQVGLSTKVQVLTIASRMREIELAVQRAHNQYNQAIYSLKEAMNLDFKVDLRLRGDLFRDFYLEVPEVRVEELVERARSLRPEYKRSLAQIHRLKKEREITEDEWIPRISVGGYVGHAGEEFPLREDTWGVNFRVTFPIGSNTASTGSSLDSTRDGSTRTGSTNSQIALFDDLGRERRSLESKTALSDSINEHNQLVNSLAIEVSRAHDNLRESWESIRIGNGRVYFQYASIRILEKSYAAGSVRRADILEAEIELVRAQEDLTDAIAAYLKAVHEIEFVSALEAGALNLYRVKPGEGNTLPGKLLSGDFDQIEQQGKQDLDPGRIREQYLEKDRNDANETYQINRVPLD